MFNLYIKLNDAHSVWMGEGGGHIPVAESCETAGVFSDLIYYNF